ncbi:UV-damage endonuclease [Cladophialophora chaetospira]|uniref:UV-damage endonuclease n=1 Tax=Cladophialophora chaetospira TaxID=386627 RepID=A0AA38WX01_9EURO|nr:UV-damage endonuclease [Cladophialophora chaetospira]
MGKRKRASEVDAPVTSALNANITSVTAALTAAPPVRRMSSRKASNVAPAKIDTNPDTNNIIEDGQDALRASPDDEKVEMQDVKPKKPKRTPAKRIKVEPKDAEGGIEEVLKPNATPKTPVKRDDIEARGDPEAEGDEDADPEELKEALSRPPPVNSSYLPLPWEGRLGYACLNTYLRAATPPIFSSRTCRIASILEHRHPLKDPSQPEHATKNRPDKEQAPDVARGQAYVEALGLANAQDIPKMLRWNDRYGIRFFRLSSEMFPFASHDVYGYKLAPFAAEALAEAGRVAAELGHRLTTHPGQFTQLGSPRKEVITASLRDLDYHCELLDLLKLPPQQDRDAVMVLHMGGAFGDKAATIDRFKENYQKLPQGVKNRIVLENDDVIYSVHDLLPVCEELNIPLVLDYHHHNIIFDADELREGTLDIMNLYDRIKATWTRKNITQKMHYSEPTPQAITGRQRRKHNPRPATLPPCAPDMDLMIEAKDKEQAVFELMRTFKLPGFDTFNDILPYVRNDENKPWKPPKKKAPKKKRKAKNEEDEDDIEDEEAAESEPQPPPLIPDAELSMGGPEGRVYWPPGMEEWLRPKKREVKPRDPEKAKTTAERAALRRAEKAAWQAAREASADGGTETATATGTASETDATATPAKKENLDIEKTKSVYDVAKTNGKKQKPARAAAKKTPKTKTVLTPSDSGSELTDLDEVEDQDIDMLDLTDADEVVAAPPARARKAPSRTTSGRSAKKKAVNYADGDEDEE